MKRYVAIARCLGWRWVLFRLSYALQRRLGLVRRRTPCGAWSDGGLDYRLEVPPFRGPGSPEAVATSRALLQGRFLFFCRHERELGYPPDWFANPFAGEPVARPEGHWSTVSDVAAGDIKGQWELSRFGFVFALARAWAFSGDEAFPEAFWQLLLDWRDHNPPNTGPQWRCGQESAFRLMAWCFGAGALANAAATTRERRALLAEMVAVSATRIEGNIAYALSQDNNHGISEAMGLWTAGLVLPDHPRAARWESLGRELLEAEAQRLIYPDGTFSQHSINYHRLTLQDYLWAVQLGKLRGRTLSDALLARLRTAGEFLEHLTDSGTGFAPNIGSNDGALVLPLADCDYRDMRPTVQAVAVLTTGRPVYPSGRWDGLARWMGLDPIAADTVEARAGDSGCDDHHPDGGIVILRGRRTRAVVRCTPAYRHRPTHADQLHLDLWLGSVNVLRDAGSFSYNCAPPWQTYFRSTAGHNTIEFDGRDQMPRLGRFLYGAWLAVRDGALRSTPGQAEWEGWYEDYRRCRHRRRVVLDRARDEWQITDQVSGPYETATLRWRLTPEWEWSIDGQSCRSPRVALTVEPPARPTELTVTTGWESLYYQEKTEIPVLEAVLPSGGATVITTVRLCG